MAGKHASPLPEDRKRNRAQIAALFEVSLTTVDGWVRKGCPVHKHGSKGVAAEYDLREVARWLYAGTGSAINNDPDRMPPQDQRAWYDAQNRKRDMMVRDGELVPRGELEHAISTAFAAVTQDLLTIPDQLERLHAVPPDVASRVDHAICGVIEALRKKLADLAPEGVPA